MKNSVILLNGTEPKGRYVEGIISGTPKPGVAMQVQAGTAPVNGRLTYEVYNPSADGDPREVLILLEDSLQGKLYSDAYVSGTRGFLYAPIPGDEFNMIVLDVAGTGDDHTIGERMMLDQGTGKLVTQGTSANRAQFQLLEAATDPAADAWMWCVFTGY